MSPVAAQKPTDQRFHDASEDASLSASAQGQLAQNMSGTIGSLRQAAIPRQPELVASSLHSSTDRQSKPKHVLFPAAVASTVQYAAQDSVAIQRSSPLHLVSKPSHPRITRGRAKIFDDIPQS